MVVVAYEQFCAALAIGFTVMLLLAFLRIGIVLTAALAAATVVAALFVPVIWSSAFTLARSILGPLSAGFLVFCVFSAIAFATRKPTVTPRDEGYFALVIAVGGAILILSAMGYLSIDVYAVGYDTKRGLLVIAVILAGALAARSIMAVAWVALGCILWMTGLTGSLNLWDSFVDPVAWIASVVLLAAHLSGLAGYSWPYLGYRMSSRPSSQASGTRQ